MNVRLAIPLRIPQGWLRHQEKDAKPQQRADGVVEIDEVFQNRFFRTGSIPDHYSCFALSGSRFAPSYIRRGVARPIHSHRTLLGASMLLAIDLGNTNTVFGVYDTNDKLVMHWRLSTQKERTVDEYGILLRNLFALEKIDAKKIRRVIIASVVPPLDPVLNEMVSAYFAVKPVFVTHENAGIPVLYDDPREVGADRIVNAVAVVEKYGKPAIVVDFGTATTFDAITAGGEYRGGVIAPGIVISAQALYEHAAKLPRIEIQKPANVIGSSTTGSMQSGLFYGYVALVDGIITRMKKELGSGTRVIGTGGQAPFISQETKLIETVDPNLTLDGLQLVASRLSKR
jgi:type III pantothenate kinase